MVGQAQPPTLILIWLGVLASAAVIASLIGLLIFRRLKRGPHVGSSFTLADLRTMRDHGQLTEQEYHRTKAIILNRQLGTVYNDPTSHLDGPHKIVGLPRDDDNTTSNSV